MEQSYYDQLARQQLEANTQFDIDPSTQTDFGLDEFTVQPGKTEQKTVNLYDKSQQKTQRLAGGKSQFQASDSFALDYQDLTNTAKDVWNFIAPSKYEADKYELVEEGPDKGNLYLLGEDNQRLTQIQQDRETGEYASLSGNDGDTYGGARTVGGDTPESKWMGDEGSKFQRLRNEYGIEDADQITAGKNATEYGNKWLEANQNTEAKVTGTDSFGRQLVYSPEYNKAMISAGYMTPAQDAEPEMWQAYQEAKDKKLGNFSEEVGLKHVMDAMELDGSKYADGLKAREDTFEFVDALQSGTVALGGKALKFAGELVDGGAKEDGYFETLGKYLQENADEIAGYNNRGAKKGELKFSMSKRKFEQGDVLGGLAEFAGGVWEGGPQMAAQSLPEMLAIGATAAAFTNPITGLVVGSSVIGALNANDALDQREINNDGRKATAGEILATTGAHILKSAAEYGVFKYVALPKGGLGIKIKGVDGIKPLEEALKITTPARKTEFVKAMVLGATAEGLEEPVMSAVEEVVAKIGTDKYKDMTVLDILKKMEEDDKFIQAFGGGFGAGLVFGAPKNTAALASGLKEDRVNKQITEASTSAGLNVEDQADVELKVDVAEQDVNTGSRVYNEIQNIYDVVDKAETADEVVEAMKSATWINQIGLPGEVVGQLIEAKATGADITQSKEIFKQQLQTYSTVVAEAVKQASTFKDSVAEADTERIDTSDVNIDTAEPAVPTAEEQQARTDVEGVEFAAKEGVSPDSPEFVDTVREGKAESQRKINLEARVKRNKALDRLVNTIGVDKLSEDSQKLFTEGYDSLGYNKIRKEAVKLAKEQTAEAKLNKEVAVTKEAVSDITPPSTKSFVGKVLNKVLGGKNVLPSDVRKEVSQTINKMSINALKKLNNDADIQEMSDYFADEKGVSKITPKQIKQMITGRISKRKQSDVIARVGVDDKEATYTPLLKSLNKVLEPIKGVSKEDNSKEAQAARGKARKVFLELLDKASPEDAKALVEKELVTAFKDTEGNTAKVSVFHTLLQDTGLLKNDEFFEQVKAFSTKVREGTGLTLDEKAEFVTDVMRAKTVDNFDEINISKQYLVDLNEAGEITQEQFNRRIKTLDEVANRSKQRVVEQQIANHKAEKKFVQKQRDEVENNEDIPQPMKDAWKKMSDDAVLELSNVAEIDDNTMSLFEKYNIDINKKDDIIEFTVDC